MPDFALQSKNLRAEFGFDVDALSPGTLAGLAVTWCPLECSRDQDRNQLWEKKFLESRFQLGLDAAPVTSRDSMQGPTNQTETKTNYGAKKCPEAVLYCASAFFGASDPLGKYWQPLIIRWAQEVQRSSCTQRKYCTDPALILGTKEKYLFKVCYHLCYFVKDIFFALVCSKKARLLVCFLANEIIGSLAELKGLRHLCMPAMPSVATFLATLRYFGCHPPVLLKRQCVQSSIKNTTLSHRKQSRKRALCMRAFISLNLQQWSIATTKQPIWPK